MFARSRTKANTFSSSHQEYAMESFARPKKSNSQTGIYGGKTIGFWGSVVLCLNNATGPGMLAIPLMFQQAGYVVTIALLLTFMITSALCSCFLSEAMSIVPPSVLLRGKRIEYTSLVHIFFGDFWHVVSQVLLCMCLQSINIAGIVASSQAMDNFLLSTLGQNCALQVMPALRLIRVVSNATSTTTSSFGFGFSNSLLNSTASMTFSTMDGASTIGAVLADSMFADPATLSSSASTSLHLEPSQQFVISLGYLLVMAIAIPLGTSTLERNMRAQFVSGTVSMCAFLYFVFHFSSRPWDTSQLRPIGSNRSQVISVAVMSYAFVATVPSWLNEKQDQVAVRMVVWTSVLLSTLMYIALGVLGALSYPHIHTENILSRLGQPSSSSSSSASFLTEVAIVLFIVATIVPGGAIASVLVKYNLFSGGVCSSQWWASFWGVWLPWLAGFLFYSGTDLAQLINWSAVLFTGVVNFVIPLLVYLRARKVANLRKPLIGQGMLDLPPGTSSDDGVQGTVLALPHTVQQFVSPENLGAAVLVVVVGLLVGQAVGNVLVVCGAQGPGLFLLGS